MQIYARVPTNNPAPTARLARGFKCNAFESRVYIPPLPPYQRVHAKKDVMISRHKVVQLGDHIIGSTPTNLFYKLCVRRDTSEPPPPDLLYDIGTCERLLSWGITHLDTAAYAAVFRCSFPKITTRHWFLAYWVPFDGSEGDRLSSPFKTGVHRSLGGTWVSIGAIPVGDENGPAELLAGVPDASLERGISSARTRATEVYRARTLAPFSPRGYHLEWLGETTDAQREKLRALINGYTPPDHDDVVLYDGETPGALVPELATTWQCPAGLPPLGKPYHALLNNCATFVKHMLGAGGLTKQIVTGFGGTLSSSNLLLESTQKRERAQAILDNIAHVAGVLPEFGLAEVFPVHAFADQ